MHVCVFSSSIFPLTYYVIVVVGVSPLFGRFLLLLPFSPLPFHEKDHNLFGLRIAWHQCYELKATARRPTSTTQIYKNMNVCIIAWIQYGFDNNITTKTTTTTTTTTTTASTHTHTHALNKKNK